MSLRLEPPTGEVRPLLSTAETAWLVLGVLLTAAGAFVAVAGALLTEAVHPRACGSAGATLHSAFRLACGALIAAAIVAAATAVWCVRTVRRAPVSALVIVPGIAAIALACVVAGASAAVVSMARAVEHTCQAAP